MMHAHAHFEHLTAALNLLPLEQLEQLADMIESAANRRGRVFVAGNGGSMANAQHWVCDLMKAAFIPATALGSNAALLSAYSNDLGYEQALTSEFLYTTRDDALIVLSCSGTSLNVRQLITSAKRRRMSVALVTSTLAPEYLDVLIVRVPSDDFGVIEDAHSAIGHWLTKRLVGGDERAPHGDPADVPAD